MVLPPSEFLVQYSNDLQGVIIAYAIRECEHYFWPLAIELVAKATPPMGKN